MQTTLVLLHAHYDVAHLAQVTEDMSSLGSPELLGVVEEDCIYLLEGCHRARAAVALGLVIRVIPVTYDWQTDGDYALCRLFDRCDSDGVLNSVSGRAATGSSCVDAEVELLGLVGPDHSGAELCATDADD
jgi:hypothetical protein